MNAFLDVFKTQAGLIADDLRLRLGGLAKDERGVSAVEFAMLLPLMLTLYLGAVEISQGIGVDRKVTLTARTVADLVSQVTSVSNNDMTNSLNAATAVMAPFPTGNLKVDVSSVTIDAQGNGHRCVERHVEWHGEIKGRDRDIAGRARIPNIVADLERGAVHLQAGDRPCRDRHVERSRTRSTCVRGCPTTWRAPRADGSRPIAPSRRSAAPSST